MYPGVIYKRNYKICMNQRFSYCEEVRNKSYKQRPINDQLHGFFTIAIAQNRCYVINYACLSGESYS